jgi:hypothetical protein
MKLRQLSLCGFVGLVSTSLCAQTLDCAGLANSMFAEPAGYAEQCRPGQVPQPSVAVGPSAPTDLGFTVDVRGNLAAVPVRPQHGLYSFTLNAFQTQTLAGTTNANMFSLDFNPDATTLFGVVSSGTPVPPNALTLGTINRTTGAYTVIAPLTGLTAGDNPTGMTISPRSGAAFLSAVGGATASSRLYSLNLTTGAATLIGPITAPTDPTGTIMIDIAMNCSGQLFAHSISDDALYSVNTTTGAGTLIGTHGLAANFAQGMDFDNDTGTLYAFIYTGAGTNRFGTFNLATGAFTSLTTDNPLGEFEGAIPTRCPALVTPVLPSGTPINLNFAPGASETRTLNFTGNGAVTCTITGPFTVTPSSFNAPGSVVVTPTGVGTGELVCSTGATVVARYPLGSRLVAQANALSPWSFALLLGGFTLIGLFAARRFS